MKVLVYGMGVIGSYLAHVLCAAGNDVTVLAKGSWKEHLERNGLRIRHHLQHKDTVDHPRVISGLEENNSFDAVFAVMPYDKIGRVLDPLAAVDSPLVILVGNNMSPQQMREYIQSHTTCRKEVLFAFQSTAGRRDMETGVLTCERLGVGRIDVGGLHELPDQKTQERLKAVFGKTGCKLCFQPDMEAFLICHLAAVLPIGYLTYANGGTLTSCTRKQRRQALLASREAYGMIRSLGYPILPAEDEKYYEPGMRGALMKLVYAVMAKNAAMGDLIACAHCRNAYTEMELLDDAFAKVIARAGDYPMPNWQALKAQVPDRETLRKKYTGG